MRGEYQWGSDKMTEEIPRVSYGSVPSCQIVTVPRPDTR